MVMILGTLADEVWLWMPPLAKQQMLLECIPNENKRLRSRSTSTAKYSVKRARSRVASNGSELKSKRQAWWSSLIIHLIKSSNDDCGGPFIIVSSFNWGRAHFLLRKSYNKREPQNDGYYLGRFMHDLISVIRIIWRYDSCNHDNTTIWQLSSR